MNPYSPPAEEEAQEDSGPDNSLEGDELSVAHSFVGAAIVLVLFGGALLLISLL